MKSLCLLSGGIDSTTALYWAMGKYKSVIALSFNYGQRHLIELNCSKKIAELLKIPHIILKLDFSRISSALTDKKKPLPEKQVQGIPPTWVPQRNTIFLAFGFAIAEQEGCVSIVTGMNTIDYSGYPDCRPEFLRTFEKAGNLASKQYVERGKKINIVAPFLRLKKSEIIRIGLKLGVPYQYTWSCYTGRKTACGICDSCRFRLQAFREAGAKDPIRYFQAHFE